MSLCVTLQELHQRIDAAGPQAFLVTVSQGGEPHVVSVVVRRDGDAVAFDAGRTSRGNLRDRPDATLLWPPAPVDLEDGTVGQYSLIVDGHGEVADPDADTVTVHPSTAVLHRIAGSPGEGPSCIRLLEG